MLRPNNRLFVSTHSHAWRPSALSMRGSRNPRPNRAMRAGLPSSQPRRGWWSVTPLLWIRSATWSPTCPAAPLPSQENGQPQEIRTFKREDVPVSMGLVIDNSGSMRDKRAKVAAASLALVRDSNKDDEVFVVNFNDEAFLDLPKQKDFTNDITRTGRGAGPHRFARRHRHARRHPHVDRSSARKRRTAARRCWWW